MKKEILIFWLVALAIGFGLAALLYRYAAVTSDVLAKSRIPQPMESMQDVNLGSAYGTVSVTDLVGYYIEHPPAPKGTAAADDGQHRFGGC
ncbi:hypothetical protein TPL01_15970 [Sulfuriferula plumbiphila]|uniref:Uncharacterized protein n=1 Tax=Sulfuriferula plumbiphila TaxID=171865 RepID=A0A512L7J2_9PROT|nr:hypothetical protein [Sulfuriferula plumbiphila]BBP04024.1 hypothetical protein SFPGR_14460 [Sulfuriferula plumbiphila]GEP30459.1 hypothetical protein TPL01_15970 [Sulfuriferula plumbiphila]